MELVTSNWERRVLGRTGLTVGPLGFSSSYGAPTAAIREAFEQGMNYLYWGSIRREGFAQALRELKGQREKVVLAVQEFVPVAPFVRVSVERALRRIGYDYVDVLLLGYWNQPIPARMLEACQRLKEEGKVRWIGVSSHDMGLLEGMAEEGVLDVLHFRYSAAWRGAEQRLLQAREGARAGMVSYTATSWTQLMRRKYVPEGERVPEAGDCYRFVLSRAEVDVCMVGASNLEQARHALAAVQKGRMSEEEVAWMRRVGDSVSRRVLLRQ